MPLSALIPAPVSITNLFILYRISSETSNEVMIFHAKKTIFEKKSAKNISFQRKYLPLHLDYKGRCLIKYKKK
jgi:hypothetical protein